ncbi:MAG: bacteriohopanetetrol glucosamine biosynthesis glycosyltransferase HpnI [Deltaproteobacteria bacterium]|nr:bacteriohopanetetrol glucosamine biosynthesis glycosyltransferase HpnI [Deltaproteobacteria bacterium]
MTYLLFGLALAAVFYQFLAFISLARFFRPRLNTPLPQPPPGVTVFKPVRGVEAFTRECLASFLDQDYPSFQVLFGVADPGDPVLTVLRDLRAGAASEVEIVVCPERSDLNPKVNVLRQLEPRARHDIWVVADSDVKVGRDFLGKTVAALLKQGGGLVSCPYRAGESATLGARLEALTISADFMPSVAVAHYVEDIRFALGAAMIFHREDLRRIGGFAALSDFLADDYQLGWQMHQAGAKVALSPYVVETVNPEMTFPDYLLHQLRWTRTYRVCRPKGYLAYGITHALVWSLLAWAVSGLAGLGLGLAAAALAIRLALAWFSERFCLQGRLPAAAFLLLPVKDLLAFGLWLLSFLGSEVAWQGARFRITPEGKLRPLGRPGLPQ